MVIEEVQNILEAVAQDSNKTELIAPIRKAFEDISRARKAEVKAIERLDALLLNLENTSVQPARR
jgi:seryl-tRNA synthetase